MLTTAITIDPTVLMGAAGTVAAGLFALARTIGKAGLSIVEVFTQIRQELEGLGVRIDRVERVLTNTNTISIAGQVQQAELSQAAKVV